MAAQLVPFHKPWIDCPVLIVDTETTGLRASDRACDIALVRFERGKQVAAVDSLINPLMPIPAEASAIHHITDDMVTDAPSMAAAS